MRAQKQLNSTMQEDPKCIPSMCTYEMVMENTEEDQSFDIQPSNTSTQSSAEFESSYEFRTTRNGKIYSMYEVPVLRHANH